MLQAEQFEAHRSHLQSVAYRMLGSVGEAEDAVQEAWLRLNRTDRDAIDNLGGWLTTVVGRVCIDMLRARQARREDHTPEPIVVAADDSGPEEEALLADSVGLALMVVLETLSPAERLAFVLHDMFAMPFDEIAALVDRSPEAARQLASRARRRVRGAAPATDADFARQREIVATRRAADPHGKRRRAPGRSERAEVRAELPCRARQRRAGDRGLRAGRGRRGDRVHGRQRADRDG